MSTTVMISEWLAFADDLRGRCLNILAFSQVDTTDSLEDSPALFAYLLFCRTITNFKGSILLLERQLVIESQILQRACFENSLLIRRLANDGNSAAKEISDDGLFNEASFAKLVRARSENDDDTRPLIKTTIAAGHGKRRMTLLDENPSDGAEEDYAMFRQLSMSAAHASSTSLLRHVVKHPVTDEYEIVVEVDAGDREVMANLYFTIVAMMHSLHSFVRCVPSMTGEQSVREMAARIVAIEARFDTSAYIRGA